MRDRLRLRLPKASEAEIDTLAAIVDQYKLQLTLRNLDQEGLILFDAKDRSVRVSFGSYRNGSMHIPPPNADIIVAVIDGVVSGWVGASRIEHLEDMSILDMKMLNPMPEVFDFAEKCPHMMIHGGFLIDDLWECAGCGQRIIPNGRA